MKRATAHIAFLVLVLFCLRFGVIPAYAAGGFTSNIIVGAVEKGVSSETIALLLLLPLVATLVSVMHYVLGISGYGIFMPTMMAIVMMSTGVGGGLILFGSILGVSLLSNMGLKKLKLHFWPARSMGLMMISVVVFVLMMITTYFNIEIVNINKITIYPVIFMILLTEEFVRTQLSKSRKEALVLTLGTLFLAILGTVVLRTNGIQKLVLEYPEVTILIVVVVNILVGNYKGIRLTEIKRFKNAIRRK
ncbi:MAG: 7TM domain-containing protein [Candidatus Shapirobacteria bacterium]